MTHNHQSAYLTYEAALEAQNYWLDSWRSHDGIVPDYAVRLEGEILVVNIVEVL